MPSEACSQHLVSAGAQGSSPALCTLSAFLHKEGLGWKRPVTCAFLALAPVVGVRNPEMKPQVCILKPHPETEVHSQAQPSTPLLGFKGGQGQSLLSPPSMVSLTQAGRGQRNWPGRRSPPLGLGRRQRLWCPGTRAKTFKNFFISKYLQAPPLCWPCP